MTNPSNPYPYASMRDTFDLTAYCILGSQDTKGRPVGDIVDDALQGGATFIQLRDKTADAKQLTETARDIAHRHATLRKMQHGCIFFVPNLCR